MEDWFEIRRAGPNCDFTPSQPVCYCEGSHFCSLLKFPFVLLSVRWVYQLAGETTSVRPVLLLKGCSISNIFYPCFPCYLVVRRDKPVSIAHPAFAL